MHFAHLATSWSRPPSVPAMRSRRACRRPRLDGGMSEVAQQFTLVAEQLGDTKFWLPSTIVAEPGDKVTLALKNEVPGASTHGFELPAFNISEIVTRGEKPKVVHFTVDKPGCIPYYCQLHPGHVGGQLLVEPAPSSPTLINLIGSGGASARCVAAFCRDAICDPSCTLTSMRRRLSLRRVAGNGGAHRASR